MNPSKRDQKRFASQIEQMIDAIGKMDLASREALFRQMRAANLSIDAIDKQGSNGQPDQIPRGC